MNYRENAKEKSNVCWHAEGPFVVHEGMGRCKIRANMVTKVHVSRRWILSKNLYENAPLVRNEGCQSLLEDELKVNTSGGSSHSFFCHSKEDDRGFHQAFMEALTYEYQMMRGEE